MIKEAIERLRNDPHEFRRRRDIATAKIAKLMADPPSSSRISCNFDLDASLAGPYEINKAILEMLLADDRPDGAQDVSDEIVMFFFCQGLLTALERFEELRDRLYKMGSLETQADALGMDLGTEEREILAAETDVVSQEPTSMDIYFKQGFVGSRCPKCRGKAVWHPQSHQAICMNGCGRLGKFDRRPVPGD